MRFALDSNILIYAEGVNDMTRQAIALRLIEGIGSADLVVPLQVAGETLMRISKGGRVSKSKAVAIIDSWLARLPVQETTSDVFAGALELAAKHAFQIWDAVILSAAAVAGASVLLSEDMQDGFTWNGVTIINPFADNPAKLVRAILDRTP